MASQLSSAQCILLTVHFASEANIRALHAFTPSRLDALSPELVLRIVLTFVPESVEPRLYTTYVGEVASRIYLEQREAYEVDTSAVASLSAEQAQKKADKLQISDLSHPSFPPDAPDDLLTRFVCHRASRIDNETGLLHLVKQLGEPFLESNEYLRMWYVSVVLPLTRLRYEYYPDTKDPPSLELFETLEGDKGIDVLLARATRVEHNVTSPTDSEGLIARDLRGLVGPWMYGHTERQRRRLQFRREPFGKGKQYTPRTGFIKMDDSSESDKTGHDWEHVFKWMVHQAAHNFALVTNAVEEWDGPGDVDLDGLQDQIGYLDDDTQAKLERQYAQAAFASCYAVEADTSETIDGAHGILARLAQLLDFEPPPELATSVKQLPTIDCHAELLHANDSTIFLEPHVLLKPSHPLSTPKLETYMLLQMMVYSAYQLAGLGHHISILNVAKLRFFSNEDEQLALVLKILHGLAARGKRNDQEWQYDYDRLIWLWSWNIELEDQGRKSAGIFGKIEKATIERELLKVLVSGACYTLVDDLFFSPSKPRKVTSDDVQRVILDQAMQLYDNASNGNRTRGNMKKASDLIKYCQGHFPQSDALKRASALIAATHSMSFYSLTLQHGVPFQPVNIRASSDPLSLLPKLLEQNTNSYTKLDDLIGIGRNLIAAGLPLRTADGEPIAERHDTLSETETKLLLAEKRVISMCVEAALVQGDFETAYSYVVNRLAPSDPISEAVTKDTTHQDDISWRAAFLAGRFRPQTNTQPTLRRLDQRTELLSLALLLAPSSSLSEILNVWRRCEEETNALLTAETAAEEHFDDRADKRHSVPGGFADAATEGMVFGQPRREVGRLNAQTRLGGGGDDEAPMGLFDVARGAAKAFSRNAFPLRATTAATTEPTAAVEPPSHQGMEVQDDGGRVRRRDMVASAVTGGLASSIGWVLGATPAAPTDEHR